MQKSKKRVDSRPSWLKESRKKRCKARRTGVKGVRLSTRSSSAKSGQGSEFGNHGRKNIACLAPGKRSKRYDLCAVYIDLSKGRHFRKQHGFRVLTSHVLDNRTKTKVGYRQDPPSPCSLRGFFVRWGVGGWQVCGHFVEVECCIW
jgi:hypothetical protein